MYNRTSEHHAIMRKTFYLLLLMILILPSLGLTSAGGLLMWLTAKDKEAYEFRWKYDATAFYKYK